jgi:hypothetical protein
VARTTSSTPRLWRRGIASGAAIALALALAVAACGGSDGGDQDDPADTPDAGDPAEDGGGEGVAEPELRAELLAMQEEDQAERTSDSPEAWQDEERTGRLAEILEEHGWPGHDLVGEDGSTAAWVIAQHSDLDPEIQAEALELLRAAVEADQASPGDLAYLEDRVAANEGRPQVYGTQIGCVDGEAQPGELVDPEAVDERRAEAGLEPLDDYLAELQPACEAEAGAQGAG